jgi:antitoxin (DNA-binding transcriptional repressor) of toxin-antitoxin stability system
LKTIEMDQATTSLAECARGVTAEPLVVMQEGKPVAVLLPLENADLETVSLSSNPQFLALIERSRVRLAHEGGLSSEEVRRQLGIEQSG